ncbi:hypothetical protein COO20_01875 [Thalassospira marina]|uniref:AAA domain-containing protein n=2 Tax=Thalassospira marina TaxID=2048283 RepID=A0A2N3KZM9_9PROT|nr:hypothetical protein COO20_01875 [Thalassospira marina]
MGIMTQRFSENRAGAQPVTLADLVPVIWRRRGVALLVLALLLAVLGAVVPLWQPDYQARAQIGFLPAVPAPLASRENAQPAAGFQISDLDTEMAVLRGTAVLSAARSVLQGEGVDFDPKPSRLAQWFGAERAVQPAAPAGSFPAESVETIREARDIAILRGKIKTAQIDNARVIEISLFDPDPVLARQMLDAVVNSYVWKRQNDLRQKLADQYAETRRQHEAALTNQQQHQQALLDWQDDHPLATGTINGAGGPGRGDDGTGRNLETIRQQREAARIDFVTLQSRQQAIADAQGNMGALLRLPEIANTESVRELNLRLADLRSKAADLARRYGARHPLVLANDAQIAEALADLDSAITAQIAAVNRDFENARTRIEIYDGEYRRIMDEMAGNNRDRLGFAQLQRALDRSSDEVALLADRARLMQSQLAALRPDVEILQVPELPGKPVFPSRRHIAMIGGFFAILLAMAAAVLREYFDRALHRANDAETLTGLPIFAVLPHVAHGDGKGRATDEENEAIGHLQTIIRLRSEAGQTGADGGISGATNPHPQPQPQPQPHPISNTGADAATPKDAGRVICVTSPMPGEGKSRLARKIAARFARNGQRVLLLDGDLRRPALVMDGAFARQRAVRKGVRGSGQGASENMPDLQLVLQGDCAFSDAVFPVHAPELAECETGTHPGYDFLGAENPVSSALAGQLMAEKLGHVIAALKAKYDFIILDAPPVLAVADAIWLMRAADDRLLLLRAGKSRRDDIVDACNRLAQAGCAADGIVFSGVSRRGAYYGSRKRRRA